MPLALTLSRLIASIAIGYIFYSYAKHTGKRKWVSATFFVIFTLVIMSVTFSFAW